MDATRKFAVAGIIVQGFESITLLRTFSFFVSSLLRSVEKCATCYSPRKSGGKDRGTGFSGSAVQERARDGGGTGGEGGGRVEGRRGGRGSAFTTALRCQVGVLPHQLERLSCRCSSASVPPAVKWLCIFPCS
jgi:hypothetical protein